MLWACKGRRASQAVSRVGSWRAAESGDALSQEWLVEGSLWPAAGVDSSPGPIFQLYTLHRHRPPRGAALGSMQPPSGTPRPQRASELLLPSATRAAPGPGDTGQNITCPCLSGRTLVGEGQAIGWRCSGRDVTAEQLVAAGSLTSPGHSPPGLPDGAWEGVPHSWEGSEFGVHLPLSLIHLRVSTSHV